MFRGLCIKGVSRVRSTKIPLSRIQEFMNINLSDNVRYYNQSSAHAIYYDNCLRGSLGVQYQQYQEYSIKEMLDSRGDLCGFKRWPPPQRHVMWHFAPRGTQFHTSSMGFQRWPLCCFMWHLVSHTKTVIGISCIKIQQ